MDKELMNDMPEEENEAVQAPADAEETAAENATEETVAEETAESDEETVIKSENSEEEDFEICPICETGKITEGKNYCEECEAIMLKRKPPFFAWICGAAVLLLSFFALVVTFLISAPAIQVIKGDEAAENNSWYTAYLEYSEVESVAGEVGAILGSSELNTFIQTGTNVKIKLIDAFAKSSNPLDAYKLASNYFTDEEMEKYPSLREYKAMKEAYTSSYEALSEILDFMSSENSTYEQTAAKFEAKRGTEGVDDIFVDYFVTAAATYFKLPAEEQIACFDKIDASAKASKYDYRWLYYLDYATMLISAGQNDKAIALLDEVIAEDNTASDYYSLKMKALVSENDLEGAEKTLSDFKKNNEGYDSAYILEIALLRNKGELDKALELCTEALEIYGTSPEIYRQRALIYLLQGKYDEAYEEVFIANSTAYNLYVYYGDTSAYSVELDHTIYVCAYLCEKYGTMETENAVYISEILSQYQQVEFSDEVNSIISGEKTVEEVLTEGVRDLV